MSFYADGNGIWDSMSTAVLCNSSKGQEEQPWPKAESWVHKCGQWRGGLDGPLLHPIHSVFQPAGSECRYSTDPGAWPGGFVLPARLLSSFLGRCTASLALPFSSGDNSTYFI